MCVLFIYTEQGLFLSHHYLIRWCFLIIAQDGLPPPFWIKKRDSSPFRILLVAILFCRVVIEVNAMIMHPGELIVATGFTLGALTAAPLRLE